MAIIPHPAATGGAKAPKLIERMRRAIRVRHYSIRTEEAYLGWVRRFFAFTRRHPQARSSDEINRVLTHLAVNDHVAASTPRQALSAILFLPDAGNTTDFDVAGMVFPGELPPFPEPPAE